MLHSNCKEARESCVKLKASPEGVRAFLKYVYIANLDDAFACPHVATDLLEIAHMYGIKPLENAVSKILMKKADEWIGIDAAVNLFLCTLRKDGLDSLNERAVKLIRL